MKNRIKAGANRYISDNDPTFIIAEMSANHAQQFSLAKKIIREAKKSGADAIKLQTYLPQTMTLDSKNRHFQVRHHKWGGQSLYELYKKAYTPWKWHKELKKIADDCGIILFSTPFDKRAVDLLESLDMPLYKIASYELTDLPLISCVAGTHKPIIMSTGMATREEIHQALDTAHSNGARDVILLKCVSSYPADPADANLMTIPDMKRTFGKIVGFSDHTLGTVLASAAVVLGARVIEKHLTLSRKIKSPDSFFSIEPNEMRELVNNIRVVEKALGKVLYGASRGDRDGLRYRRSIFVSKDINKGEILTKENLQIIRPANGLEPKYFEKVLGRKAARKIAANTPLSWKLVF